MFATPPAPIKLFIFTLIAAALSITAFADSESKDSDDMKITIYSHASWETEPPAGIPADATRRNIDPGTELPFKDMTLTLLNMSQDEEIEDDALSGLATINLTKGDETKELVMTEGSAINWNDYHIALLAVRTKKGELGFGVSEFEIATTASLPLEIAHSDKAGGASMRCRIPHKINKITLHHSATKLTRHDYFPQKLRNLQSWGASARNWWDIPYHYLIDIDGNIYQGRDHRYMGETNTKYNPSGHFLINCYGNYDEMEPNEQQLEAIVNLMAWAAAEYDVSTDDIYGHSDLAQTGCPGDNLEKLLHDGTFKRMVEEKLKSGAPTIVWSDELSESIQAKETK